MKKSFQLGVLFLFFVSSSLGGQNGFVMTVAGSNSLNNSAISFVEVALEVTVDWEIPTDIVVNKKEVPYSLDNPYIHNTIELVPSYSRQLVKLETSAKKQPKPIHLIDIQFSQVRSVVPKLQVAPVIIDKRPKSFGALYSF